MNKMREYLNGISDASHVTKNRYEIVGHVGLNDLKIKLLFTLKRERG